MSTAPLESRLSIAETVSREMGALDAQVMETDTKPVRPSHIDIRESAAKVKCEFVKHSRFHWGASFMLIKFVIISRGNLQVG
ncbi:hypothetical protein T4B_14618 [Trichinella pseudospiralis]|uniref:Uncharacterized protein n=1 Tax=Trichinella pseudospiralis TaxID=6337 RepID=A0A0V1JA54_TRIPS|nr:hypothetical protein T4B_14618 [Trichinella pseudospiralis]